MKKYIQSFKKWFQSLQNHWKLWYQTTTLDEDLSFNLFPKIWVCAAAAVVFGCFPFDWKLVQMPSLPLLGSQFDFAWGDVNLQPGRGYFVNTLFLVYFVDFKLN